MDKELFGRLRRRSKSELKKQAETNLRRSWFIAYNITLENDTAVPMLIQAWKKVLNNIALMKEPPYESLEALLSEQIYCLVRKTCFTEEKYSQLPEPEPDSKYNCFVRQIEKLDETDRMIYLLTNFGGLSVSQIGTLVTMNDHDIKEKLQEISTTVFSGAKEMSSKSSVELITLSTEFTSTDGRGLTGITVPQMLRDDFLSAMIGEKKRTFSVKKVIAGICAIVVVFGGIGFTAFMNTRNKDGSTGKSVDFSANAAGKSNSTISAGGTVTSIQLYDYIGLTSTSARLTVEDVYVEAGDTVEVGTPIYKLTDASVGKAKTVLESELRSAESALLDQKLSYEKDKNSAYSLYQSELLLGDTAKSDYDTAVTQLDDDLNDAYNEYMDAQNAVNNTPSEISSKKAELDTAQSSYDDLQNELTSLEEQQRSAQADYMESLNGYNAIVAEYNAAVGTAQYIGRYLGIDVSDIQLTETISANTADKPSDFGGNAPDIPDDAGSKPDGGGFAFSMGMNKRASAPETESIEPNENSEIRMLYDSAYQAFTDAKARLHDAGAAYRSAEEAYREATSAVNECNTQINTYRSEVSSLTKEISSLESTLSKAKSNLSSLKSAYNSLKNSYKADKLGIQNDYDTSIASYNNAKYHYDITMSTIEDALQAKQDAVDNAQANLDTFNETIADGIIYAKQSGVIYSLTYEADNNISINSPLVSYVDDASLGTTVELDQYQVTEISIGDSVMIYSSDTGVTNGTITAISAGESTSLANVKFNVTIQAEEKANIYVGQSVNVYFNASNTADFRDFTGGEGKERPRGSGRDDFDFGNMDFGNRDFGGAPPQFNN